jgi:hypothetical protein
VLLASSMMVLWDKNTLEHPYCLIKNNTYCGQSSTIPKITEEEIFTRSSVGENISVATYKNSKITAENIAKKYISKGISSISMRVGSVNTINKPPTSHTWAFTHHDDLCHFVELGVDYLLTKSCKAESIPLFLCSDNKFCIVNLEKAKKTIGYIPQRGSNKLRNVQWRIISKKSIAKEEHLSDKSNLIRSRL